MARVFIVNNAMHDYDGASKYGHIQYVTEGKVAIFKTDMITNLLRSGLADFKAEDYILVSGPAWLCMIATMIVFKNLNEVKFLVFDAKERAYIVRHLNKESLGY